jgi:hypothetical protein
VGEKLPTVEHIVAGLDEASLGLAKVSQYGEWLDQSIVCIKVGYPAVASTACDELLNSANNGIAGSNAKVTKGTAAIRSVLNMAVSR